uniref:Retrotransposon gag domain-containing protein n=1 Tax=Noccaea caerulescens TaxID=107243 RepID=A0A1J3J8R3_NOCCA
MKRKKYASLEEQEANYCQVFIEHMNRDAGSWFSNLHAGSIDSFDDLSTTFLKHFSMFMSKSSTNLFTMVQEKDETLCEFVERFKTAAAEHSDLPEKMGIKALENCLWLESKFKENLMLDEPLTPQDALHRSQNYVLVEEYKAPRCDEDDSDHTNGAPSTGEPVMLQKLVGTSSAT